MARSFAITFFAAIATIFTSPAVTDAETTFTYQGELRENGSVADGSYNMEFSLWDTGSNGNQTGSAKTQNSVQVTGGKFTVDLDFGADSFDNSNRWLEITVNGTLLSPRHPISRSPYSIQTRGIFVDEDKNVGIGTNDPQHMLDVAGDVRASKRVALGNDGTFDPGSPIGPWDRVFDFSHTISDFSSGDLWAGMRSWITLGHSMNQENTIVHGHQLITQIPSGNSFDFKNIWGPQTAAWHFGSGRVESLSGFQAAAFTNLGTTDTQTGAFSIATASGSASITDNTGHVIRTGHGGTGTITNNYGMYVLTPEAGVPPTNHYGIYLADQDVGVEDSYAVYSAGGKSYFAGNIGIGTSDPDFNLHVDGSAGKPGAGSWSTASDIRLKKNVEPLDGALSQLLRLRGVNFEYIDPEAIDELSGVRTGVIAQEVAKVFPDWVDERSDGFKAVTFRGFEALTVEALRELREEKSNEIALLRASSETLHAENVDEINSLRNENDALRARLDAVERLVEKLAPTRKEQTE